MNRSGFPDSERRHRSRLAQAAHNQRLMRGTLSVRHGRCSKPNCRCARGELHTSLYLVQSQQGKMRQICVPKAWEERVRQAVGDYQEIRRLLEEISEREWKRLQERKP